MASDLLPIDIPPGVVKGATPLDTRGRWFDTNLVRWRNGVLEPVRGWERTTATALDGRARKLEIWRTNTNDRFLLAATDQKLWVDHGGSFVDVTPVGLNTVLPAWAFTGFGTNEYSAEGYGTERSNPSVNIQITPPYWTIPNWGENKLAVLSVDGKLYQYDPNTPDDEFEVIATAPVGNAAVHVTPERHVILVQVAGNPRRVGWSSREDNTDWNFASTTNSAGYIDLETSTPLIKAVQHRAGTLVFSHSDVFLMQYVGQPYIFATTWLGASRVVGPDAIVAENGNVFWWATDGFKYFDGNSIQTIPCPVWDYVMSRTNLNALRVFAHGGAMGLYPEVWFFYPSTDAGICDSYVMGNYDEGWWAIGSLDRSAMVAAGADKYPYMAGEDGHVYRHESGWVGATGGVRPVYAESSALTIGAGMQFMEVKQALVATGHGYDGVQARFLTNRTPEGSEREFGPYSVRPDGWMDTRVSGRDIRVRLESKKDRDWSIGQLRLDVATGARR